MKRERLIILDALRAMAGLTVPLFHICENLGRPPLHYESVCGHGYLAVEFFLLLMGYMLAYAYDQRWSSGMGVGEFFRRRLVRLHPLVISGVLLGVVVFCVQSALGFSWMSWLQGLPAWKIALLALWSMTMVPVIGVGLINPFNACSWTLYYEYAGNILYALGLRKLGKRTLLVCAVVASFFWLCYVMHINLNGVFGTHLNLFDTVAANALWSIVCGWGDSAKHFYGGFVRLALPLFLGLLLARLGWRIQLKKGAFAIAVAVFALILYMPFPYELGGEGHYWVNALFEFLVVTVVFPLLILVGVGSRVELPSRLAAVVTYLAELSYPLYMSHFMFMGVFRTWVKSLAETSSTASIVLASAATYLAFVAIAALMMHVWDRPIQRFLSKLHFHGASSPAAAQGRTSEGVAVTRSVHSSHTHVLLAFLLVTSGGHLAFADSATIPFVADGAIMADGVMRDGEWSRATHLTGFRQAQKDRLVSRDAEILLAADGECLHVAAITPTEGSETDGGFVAVGEDGTVQVCKDDCFEFFLANEPGGAATNVYQVLVNSRGAKFEGGRGASKAEGLGKTAIATRVHGGYWYVEASIPWTKVPGIDPRRFRFNAARNFVRSGYGYASLTAQRYPYDASKYWSLAAKDGFGGVQVKGLDSSLSSGRFRLEAITPGVKSEIKARLFKGDRTVLVNDPAREQKIPSGDDWMAATAEVFADGFGKVYHHSFLPFELGKSAGNFPVTMKKRIDDLGTVFLRFYPCASKAAVVVDGMPPEARQAEASVTGPDGATASAPLVAQPDGTFKAMVVLPPEKKRAAGRWKGRVAFTSADGRRREFADAFEFTERKFPWQHNRIGYSSKVLAPFTPIEMKRQSAAAAGDAGWTLKTVLREHRLGADGLLAGAKSKGDEIFTAPFTFRAKVNGKSESFAAERFDVLEMRPNGVRLRAVGRFGTMRFTADVAWDYDGFALVTGTMSPVAKTTIEELTIVAPMKKAEATLFHALVDMTRGNPAGLIPDGDGVVWDSSRLKRRANDLGMPNFPGEFTPYVWFGGEEKGLALLFDSPKGYDLEDGKPMVRIVRAADRVTCECDVVSRAHSLAGPTTFQFGYQVTPVKPLQEGSELWVPQYGNRLPGMVHISPIVTGANFGLYPQGFLKMPTNTNNWIQAKAFRKAMRTRRIDYKALEYIHGEGDRQTAEWAERNRDLYARSYHKSGETYRRRLLMYQHDQLTRDAMTLDRAIVYSCATLFSNTADDAYNYYRAEWYTMQPWGAGMTDRVFLTPDTVDYLVWTYRDLLKNGADGINFDETFVVSQTNPDLSEVRDYKGRVIPETGILAARGMMRRLAHLMDDMGFKDRLLAPHLTNTMIIPEFAFCNIGICWEYGTYGNFIDLFPPDYCRAHSSGLQAGLKPFALFCYENDPMRGKVSEREYCERRNRSFRTALAMSLQHEIQPMQRYWGDFTEQYWARYVLWAFGTHKKDCAFMPYWKKGNPFSVSDGFIVGAYRRGSSVLFVVSNLGKKAMARIAFDPKAMGLGANAKALMIGPPFGNCRKPDELALSSEGRSVEVEIPDCEYKFVFVGAGEFGEMLAPPDPDSGFIIK